MFTFCFESVVMTSCFTMMLIRQICPQDVEAFYLY